MHRRKDSARFAFGLGGNLAKELSFLTACASKVALAVAGGVAALFVRSRMGAEAHETPCRGSTLMQQLKAQAPLLLQMCHPASSTSVQIDRLCVVNRSMV